MPLTEYERDWITTVADEPVTKEVLENAEKNQRTRDTFLKVSVHGVLETNRKRIDEAQQVVLKNNVETSGIEKLWLKACRKSTTKVVKMDWRAEDKDLGRDWTMRMDLEVDTKEDVGEGTQEIDETKLEALNDALASILELQASMLLQYDEEGNRLFSDDDIRRELWTPLVRSGLIPENMVPDKFSEEALAFKGAVQIYGEKIKDFTKKSTGNEKLLRNLNIAKETVAMTGTIVTSLVSISNTPTLASNAEQIRTGVGSNGAQLTPEQINQLKVDNLKLSEQTQLLTFASSVAVGGIEIISGGIEASGQKTDEGRWAKLIDKTITTMQNMIVKAVSPLSTVGIEKDSISGTTEAMGRTSNAAMVGGILQAAMTGVRLGPTLFQLAKETDEIKKLRMLDELIGKIGDGVGFSMSAYASQLGKTDPNSAATFEQIGAGLRAAIKKIGKAPLVLKALENDRTAEACMLLGGGAIQLVFSGSSEALFDAMREDSTKQEMQDSSFEQSAYQELTGPTEKDQLKQEKGQDLGSAKIISDIESAISGMDKSLLADLGKTPLPQFNSTEAAEIQKQIALQLDKEDNDLAQKKLAEHFTPEAVDEMFKEFGTKMVGYEEMYAAAYPQSELDGQPETDVEKALEAIDRAISKTAELRAKVEIVNGITAATVGVVASFVPGAGAVVAAQKIAFDIYALCQAVEMHNKWCASMELAFRANSAYGASIEKTMKNAQITLSKVSVKLVLDSLQLGAQVGRCFDPTGGATIASTTLTLTQALVDYGYKMAREDEIRKAWKAYKDALDNPGNRKRARKAMRMNSTLAKCAIAYGACMADDPVAKEAIRISGLSPSVLADDKDVCKRLVSYLENELNQDAVVLDVEKPPKPWHPAERPLLTPVSWFQYKAAAVKAATPRLAPVAANTPAIDAALAKLAAPDCWKGAKSYAEAQAALKNDPTRLKAMAEKSVTYLEELKTAYSAYKPVAAGPGLLNHKEMGDIVKTYSALIKLNLKPALADKV
jgi:hypothetical protein